MDASSTPLTHGVALITYNGMKYLPQQLSSILAQTRIVEHIVVSDDRSSDGTWEYLEGWARNAPVRVTLVRNETQLGLSANFEQAISLVEADVVFSSDQDDVWLPDKVALLAAVFEEDERVQLVHTDAILVDTNGHDLGMTLFGELGLSRTERHAIRAGDAFRVYCRRNVVTGATAAFRRTLLTVARPFPTTFVHDAWLALMATSTGRVVMIDTPTIHYRQHGANLIGVKRLNSVEKLRRLWWEIKGPRPLAATTDNLLASIATLHARLSTQEAVAPSHVEMASEILQFATYRTTLPANPVARCAAVISTALAGHYHRFSHQPWPDALRDMLNK
jgi:glycosyltransferase involved in cell wall biosynthesis